MWFKVIFLSICLVESALSFSTGGGTSACETLMPSHNGALPQQSLPPVVITQSNANIQQGQSIIVTVTSSPGFTFRGFMAQARSLETNSEVLGRFVLIPSMRTVNCVTLPAQSVATHTSNEERTTVTLMWQAYTSYLGAFNFM